MRQNSLRLPLGATTFLACLILSTLPSRADFEVLHNFSGGANDGALPKGSLTISGSMLYGTTSLGGSSNNGTVFKIGTDGSGFSLLHSFGGKTVDGGAPAEALLLSGSTLFGTTTLGTQVPGGTVFKIQTDGTNFGILHTFAALDAFQPTGSLIQSGSTLYGTTFSGGAGSKGTVYEIGTDGSGYGFVHSFDHSGAEGANPTSSVTQSGSTLYGATPNGGAFNGGVIYKVGTNGTGFSVLHSFQLADGNEEVGGLVASGSVLYGMTEIDGPSNVNGGTIFKMGVDGTGFSVLHTFLDDGGGTNPTGGLIQSGTILYGMTPQTIFQMNTDGTGFRVLHDFDSGEPVGSLVLSGSTLYGMTSGSIFSINVPEPGTFAMLAMGSAGLLLWARRRKASG